MVVGVTNNSLIFSSLSVSACMRWHQMYGRGTNKRKLRAVEGFLKTALFVRKVFLADLCTDESRFSEHVSCTWYVCKSYLAVSICCVDGYPLQEVKEGKEHGKQSRPMLFPFLPVHSVSFQSTAH